MTERFSTEWGDARARGAFRAGLRAALEEAMREAAEIQRNEVAGPLTPAAGAIRVMRAIERLLEGDGEDK